MAMLKAAEASSLDCFNLKRRRRREESDSEGSKEGHREGERIFVLWLEENLPNLQSSCYFFFK